MGLRAFFAIAGSAIALFLSTPAEAQEVQCLACAVSTVSYNSYCQSFNGSWPNCQTICDGFVCSCKKDVSARCRRGGDGTFYGFRVQDVFYLPADQPFHVSYRVKGAKMTRRAA